MSSMMRVSLLLVLCLELSHLCVAFQFSSRPKTSDAICLNMCKPSPAEGVFQRRIKSAITAVIIAASTADTSFALPDAPAPITRSVLEQSIQTLEASSTRSEVIQSLADVFEAAGTKTLLVRTKYKYVSNDGSELLTLERVGNIRSSYQNVINFFQRIVNAINDKHRRLNNEWDQALGYASGELKRRADPLRTVDLGNDHRNLICSLKTDRICNCNSLLPCISFQSTGGYLKIAPFVGGAGYLGSLFVQQALPELFVFAYPIAVFVFAAPIVFIIIAT